MKIYQVIFRLGQPELFMNANESKFLGKMSWKDTEKNDKNNFWKEIFHIKTPTICQMRQDPLTPNDIITAILWLEILSSKNNIT